MEYSEWLKVLSELMGRVAGLEEFFNEYMLGQTPKEAWESSLFKCA